MKISVIIPAFNEEKLLPATIASVRQASQAFGELSWQFEIIVCDNNSTDGTAQIARDAQAMVVFEPINQIARARNCGAKAASGDWLIFVDADTLVSRELFSALATLIEAGHCLAGGATLRPDKTTFTTILLAEAWNFFCRWRRWFAGSFIFCEAKTFRELGGFNEKLFASEDVDLSIRLKHFAKKKGRSTIVLARHPIVTSARKMKLYTRWEHLRFLLRTLLTRGKTLADQAECHSWYDGRR